VGISTETISQILGGLAESDRVVVDGTDRLIEGATVRVRKAGELENPAGFDPTAGGGGGGRGKGGRGKNGKGGKRGDGSFKKGQGGGDSQ
jgi:hypothetical protein